MQLSRQRSTRDGAPVDEDDDDDDDHRDDAGSISCRCERLARNPGSARRLNAIKQLLLEHSPAARGTYRHAPHRTDD